MAGAALGITLYLLSAVGLFSESPRQEAFSKGKWLAVHEASMDGFAERAARQARQAVDRPVPPLETPWGLISHALALLWLEEEKPRWPEANDNLLRVSREWPVDPRDFTEPAVYWGLGALVRILYLFHADSPRHPGRLRPETESAVAEMLWDFCYGRSALEDASTEKIHLVFDSENHHVMHKTVYALTADWLAQHPGYRDRVYADGSTPVEQREAWQRYWMAWLRERALNGLWVEQGSSTYVKYSLQSLFNLHDFSSAEEVREQTRRFLDLCWVEWGQTQIRGVRGGGLNRTRVPGAAAVDSMWGLSRLFFGETGGFSNHPAILLAATTGWRPPPAATALALGPVPVPWDILNVVPGRGTTENHDLLAVARSRLETVSEPRHRRVNVPLYTLNPEPGILQSVYRTSGYLLGMQMTNPNDEYTLIHRQTRLAGLTAPTAAHPNLRIVPAPLRRGGGLPFDSHWGAHAGTFMILQNPPWAPDIEAMRWFVSPQFERMERGGWTFFRHGEIFAALRVLLGDAVWEGDRNEWLVLENRLSPVILQAGSADDFEDWAVFQDAVLAAPLEFGRDRVDYQGPGSKRLTFFPSWNEEADHRLPRVHGKELDFKPANIYRSPFLQLPRGGDTITITVGPFRDELTFSRNRSAN